MNKVYLPQAIPWGMLPRKALLAFFTFLLVILCAARSIAQTTLATGDVAVIGINATNPDQFRFVLLKSITAGTIINFTDNGFTAGSTGRTGEGFLTFTAASAYSAGTTFFWQNGAVNSAEFSSNAPTNFAFNASGDQLFIFQGATAGWANQTGITLIEGINYGAALSSTSSASNTVQPTSLPASAFLNLPATTQNNGYFSNTGSAAATVTITNTAANLLAAFVTSSLWFTQSNATGATTFPTYNITVGSPCPPLNAGSNGTLTICAGTTVTTSQLFAALGGTPDAGGSWSPTLAGAGTYTYTVNAVSPCTGTATATVTVTAQAAPNAGTNGTLAICAGTSVTAAQLFAALGGSPQSGGTWSPTLAGAGTYTYTVNAVSPCTGSATATVTVTEQAAPNAGSNGTLTICAGTTVTTSQLFAALGGTPDAGGSWSPTLAGAGTYTYTVNAVSPCTGTATATVTVSAQAAPDAGTNGTLAICAGTSVTTSQLFAALGGTPDAGGSWSPTLAGADTYTYTVNAVSPCTGSATATITVTEQAAPNAGTDGTLAICAGSSVTTSQLFAALGGLPDAGGSWSPALAGAGVYTYTVNATAPCTINGTASVTVTEVAAPNAGTNGSISLSCSSASLTTAQLFAALGGTPDAGGSWSPAPAGAGTYTYTVSAVSPCTTDATSTVVVTSSPDAILPTITAPAAVSACTNLNCTAAGVNLGTPVTADNCTVASVTNDAPAAFPLGATTVTWTVTDAAGNTATATQTVTVTDGTAPSIYITQTGLVPGVTGASSSATPYVLPVKPGVKFTSILTVGDAVGGYKMAGIPDGLGAFDNCDGTFTLLMNHEIGNTLGVVRDHGAKGAFVSNWIINKSNLSVVSGSDLMKTVYGWNSTTQKNDTTTPFIFAFSRFCSGDLPAVSAYYNAATGLGSKARIYMHGEEGGVNGYQLASVASGADKGKSYILGKFNLATNGSGLIGVGGWENALANPFAQNKTIVIGNNDGGTGIMTNTVSVYVGTKTNTGSEVDKAGLNNGTIKFVEVAGNPLEIPTANTTSRATNITSGTAFTLSGTSSTTFSRPEDGVWNPSNPAQYFFVTTDRLDQVADGVGTQIGRSRLWRLNFTDITNPDLGGTIDLLLDGTEGHNMLDNMTADKSGHLILLEDVGNAAHNGKIWQYTIATDQLTQIGKHDPARFGDIGIAPTAPFNVDEETSGVIDVSDILGAGMHLLVDQAHYTVNPPITADLVEGGQLLAMFNPQSVGTTSTAVDTVKITAPFGSTTITGVSLGTPATADNCSVASVTNNAPTAFPIGTTIVTWTVTDGAGNTATAKQVVIVTAGVNNPPAVSITSPTAPANFTTNSTIPVKVTATDTDGTIKKVEIFVNGALFGTDSTAPYVFTGANVAAGVYKVTAKATDNFGATKETDTLTITVADCSGSGSISGEGFTNINGSAVVNLTSSPKFINNQPDITAALGSFEYQNVADNYGGRVRGYICAPATGNYRFWIAADEQATLFLSTDANEANIVPIAYTTAPTGFRQYAKYSSQISALIPLVKGAKYYIQTLHKEATGADHLTVAWQLPNGTFEGPVPGSRLSPYTGAPAPLAARVVGARNFAIAMESNTVVKDFKVTATPNPSSNYFTLSIKSNLDKAVSVKIMDAAGRLVETKLNAPANSTLQIGDKLLPGVYFVEVLQGNKVQRLKLVKQ